MKSQSFMDTLMGLDKGPNPPQTPPVALSIGGSDSGGGAGIQADIKTFSALKVHGTTAITLLTAQNTRGVQGIHPLPPHVVRAQLESLRGDLPAAATKTGALGNIKMMAMLVEWFEENKVKNLVVDPVMVSKHGDPLMDEPSQAFLRDRLLEHALLVTPNHFEAQAMTHRDVGDLASMKEAAKRIFDRGPKYVLIKGSHLDKIVRDLVYDGKDFVEFGADRIRTTRLHGSGCTYSAAITARLAHGDSLLHAIDAARTFITKAIDRAPALGGGVAPVNPMFDVWD